MAILVSEMAGAGCAYPEVPPLLLAHAPKAALHLKGTGMRTSWQFSLCCGGGAGGGRPIPGRMDGETLWEQTRGPCSGRKVPVHTAVGAPKAVLGRKSKKENATHNCDALT